MLRYVEIALLAAFVIVLFGGAMNKSTETNNPSMFVIAVLASFIFGWMLPKLVQFIRTKMK